MSRVEVVRDSVALLIRRDIQKPEQQKKSHHRGHEIGISDFPGAAVMAAAFFDGLFNDDVAGFFFGHFITYATLGSSLSFSSSSRKPGWTSCGRNLRANSTATCGGAP